MSDEFLIGMFLTATLITLGVVIGYVFGRRNDSKTATPANEMAPLLANLRRFTNNFSRDVSAYGSVISTASEQARELVNQPANTSEATSQSALLLMQIMEANELLQKRLGEAESSLQTQTQQLHTYMTEARTDLLTGLSNRRAFDEELIKRHALFQRQKVPVAVLLLDVDHFKSVNDQHGHAVGDIVLKRIAEALDRSARDTDLVARYGGEEFVVAMAGTSPDEFSKAADRLRRAVGSIEVRLENKVLKPTVSCGVAELQPNETPSKLIERADEALYAAKANGRNCAYFQDGSRVYRVQIATQPNAPSANDTALPQSEQFMQICNDLRRKLTELQQK
jgi:diguanylate cyclase